VFTKNPATDLNILSFIYDHYYDDFCSYDTDESIRASKIYVPIDCEKVAKHFGLNGDIVFGRLYYHLANKYKYQHAPNVTVKIFEFEADGDPKCVHFPYLASVVSELKLENKRFKQTLQASIIAVVISIASLSITSYEKLTFSSSEKAESVEDKHNQLLNKDN
jgi:hypothetical protein